MSRSASRILKRGVTVAVTIAVSTLLVGCGSSSTKSTSSPSVSSGSGSGSASLAGQTLKVGAFDNSFQALFQASGALNNLPYKIKWVVDPAFGEADGLLSAFASGAIQVATNGSLPVSTAIYGKFAFKILSAVEAIPDPAVNGGGLITPSSSDIHTLADLRGKTVAVARNSGSQYYLDYYLREAGVPLSSVNFKFVDPQDAVAAFAGGSLDAWMTYGSYSGQFLSTGKARTVIDDLGNGPGGKPTGIKPPNFYYYWFAPTSALQGKSALFRDFVHRTAIFEKWAYSHQAEATKVVAKADDLPDDVASGVAVLFHNQQLQIDPATIKALQETADACTQFGILPGKIDVAPYFDASYNSAVAG
jgi:sulfonate transport system substrate-binding protein